MALIRNVIRAFLLLFCKKTVCRDFKWRQWFDITYIQPSICVQNKTLCETKNSISEQKPTYLLYSLTTRSSLTSWSLRCNSAICIQIKLFQVICILLCMCIIYKIAILLMWKSLKFHKHKYFLSLVICKIICIYYFWRDFFFFIFFFKYMIFFLLSEELAASKSRSVYSHFSIGDIISTCCFLNGNILLKRIEF